MADALRKGADQATPTEVQTVSMAEIFWYFLKLGWLAFGGPVGQIGLMHLEVVERRQWINEEEFVRALNFCQCTAGARGAAAGDLHRLQEGPLLGRAPRWHPLHSSRYITLTVLAWIYVRFGTSPQVLGVLWGFRPVGLALLLAALVRISRAALKGIFPVVLAAAAFVAFYLLRLPYRRLNVVVVVLAGGALGLLRAFAPGLLRGGLLERARDSHAAKSMDVPLPSRKAFS